MGYRKMTHRELEIPENIRYQIIEFKKELDAVKSLKPGRTYTLYVPKHPSEYELTACTLVEKKRILVGHYNGFAQFKSAVSGLHESYRYSELVHYLRKPAGMPVIAERKSFF